MLVACIVGAFASSGERLELLGSSALIAGLALLPYVPLYAAASLNKHSRVVMAVSICCFVVDILVRTRVTLAPQSSTDAVALVFLPFWLGIATGGVLLVLCFVPSSRTDKRQ
jgi:flagellar biosynthesis protein FliR